MTILNFSQTNQTTNYYTHNDKYNTVSNAKKKKKNKNGTPHSLTTFKALYDTSPTILYTPCPGSEMPHPIG
jgi:hypothetical protein